MFVEICARFLKSLVLKTRFGLSMGLLSWSYIRVASKFVMWNLPSVNEGESTKKGEFKMFKGGKHG